MRSAKEWMNLYGASHTNKTNQIIHKICVPLITFTILGLFWVIPKPSFFHASPYFNFATLFIALCMAFYVRLSLKLALGMLIMIAPMVALIVYIETQTTVSLLKLSTVLFIFAWAWQFIGHKIEGKKPSFFQDIQFLLIGPLWVIRPIYKKLGIEY